MRPVLFPQWILYLLSGGIIALAFINYQKEIISVHLKSILLSAGNPKYYAKEETSLMNRNNWLFLINYFATTFTAAYMTSAYFDLEAKHIVLLPFVYFFVQFFGLYLAGILAGELKKIRTNISMLTLTSHAIGILYIPLLIVWYLNPQHSLLLSQFTIALFIGLHFVRIVKGIFTGLQNKIAWYYIFLYLCTFEIWPIFALYMLIKPYFIR